jgi:hypothetical protein
VTVDEALEQFLTEHLLGEKGREPPHDRGLSTPSPEVVRPRDRPTAGA